MKTITLDNAAHTVVNQLSFNDGVKLLYEFMLKTPNVQCIKLTTDQGEGAKLWWKYLEKVLSNSSNTWKLLSIRINDMKIKHPKPYFACVAQVKPTLESLSVGQAMLERQQLSQLYQFKNLTTLGIFRGI